MDLLHRIQTDAGHIEKEKYTNSYSVVYHLTDHLGNVRHELEVGRGIKRSTSYYPYGMEWGSSSEIEYAFNGKEKMEAHGFNMYDYGARFYDQTLARWHSMDPLAEKYYSVSPYAYCAGNPVMFVDPDVKKVFLVHGTWSDTKTWEDVNGILKATKKAFNDESFGERLGWSGGNYASMRKNDAMLLVNSIRESMVSVDANEPITLVGHSHGGNVSIEAINIMAGMKEFKGRNFNLLTINTPVRDDHQLSEDAAKRVTHINVNDPKDPVQEGGGNSFRILPDYKSKAEFTGEFGKAGRTYPSDKVKQNIEVSNPQGFSIFSGEWHNSHNCVDDWIDKIKKRKLWQEDGCY